ncbi:MAG TPA: spore maturation protein [Firmicutes bacterium]|nr:spore maturation protein [Bacillota bacterium]
MSQWIVPLAVVAILGAGLWSGVKVFDVFVEGAAQGLKTGATILPALVALLTAVGMFKASGALDLFTFALEPLARLLALPREVIPLALLRPISGSGALAIFQDLLATHGPDSFVGRVASVMQGSTETTVYTIAVYYGAAGITRSRHTLAAALCADITGFVASAMMVRLLMGGP